MLRAGDSEGFRESRTFEKFGRMPKPGRRGDRSRD
jgi:hypothetical protein